MISLTILTTTPRELRDRLIARGVLKIENDELVGAHSGTEWVRVPNPIVTTPATGTPGDPGYVPAVMDSRRVYMVKFAHEAEAADDGGDPEDPEDPHPRFTRSKLVKFVRNNGTPEDIGVRTFRVGNFWVVHPGDQDIFGTWQ